MPIDCRISVPALEIDEFKCVDYRVMGHAFRCQNDLGRACDEGPYEKDLVARLLPDGFREVHCQVPIYVTHDDFSKTYFVDLIADGGLYELKAVSALGNEHKAQLLNYMLLLDVRCGKLINFQSEKVQGQLVINGVTGDDRRAITDDATRWNELSTVREITDALSDPLTLPSPQRGEGTSDSYFSNGAYARLRFSASDNTRIMYRLGCIFGGRLISRGADPFPRRI